MREAQAEPLDDLLAARLGRDDAAVLVGTYDGVTVGYGTAWVDHVRDGSRLGVIDEIYVEPGARGVGVGETLVERLVAFCRDAGCSGIDATALPGHRQAKNFFERAGFSRTVVGDAPVRLTLRVADSAASSGPRSPSSLRTTFRPFALRLAARFLVMHRSL